MAKRIERDLGQEIFIDEMKRAEARGDLPPATVRTPPSDIDDRDKHFDDLLWLAGDEGVEVIQDPTGSGKTVEQVLDHLERERQKSVEASKRAFGVDRPGDDAYGGARKFGVTDPQTPAWLRDGLRRVGIIGSDQEVYRFADAIGRDDVDPYRATNVLAAVGRGEIKHPNPKIQAETVRLYRRFKADPSYDYYGYGASESQGRLREEFPPSEDETLMENMRQK